MTIPAAARIALLCTLLVPALAPPAAGQQVARLRAGISAPAPAARLAPAMAMRRGNWEAGAVLGGLGGLAVGWMIVVNYDDGRAEKMGTGRKVLTLAGSAAVGAAIGALVQRALAAL